MGLSFICPWIERILSFLGFCVCFFFKEKLVGSNSFPLFPFPQIVLYLFCVLLCCGIYCIVFFPLVPGAIG